MFSESQAAKYRAKILPIATLIGIFMLAPQTIFAQAKIVSLHIDQDQVPDSKYEVFSIELSAQLRSRGYEVVGRGNDADLYVRGGFLPVENDTILRWRFNDVLANSLTLKCQQTLDCSQFVLGEGFGISELRDAAGKVLIDVVLKFRESISTKIYFVSCFTKQDEQEITNWVHAIISQFLYNKLDELWENNAERDATGLNVLDAQNICASGEIPDDAGADALFQIHGWILKDRENEGINVQPILIKVENDKSIPLNLFSTESFPDVRFVDALAEQIAEELPQHD